MSYLTRRTADEDALSFGNEMDRLFDSFWIPLRPLANAPLLPIDVAEDTQAFTLRAELPGVHPKDLAVEVMDNILRIRGEKKEDAEGTDGKKQVHRVESQYGSFERTLRLPGMVDAHKAEATYRDGVLTIRLPKREEAKPKSIQIRVS